MSASTWSTRGPVAALASICLVLGVAGPVRADVANGRVSFHDFECTEIAGEFLCRADIWTVRPDGSDPRRVTSGAFRKLAIMSSWSPDGTQIAYDVDDFTSVQVWVADWDGGNARQVTAGPGFHGDPAWSPDGEWLAFDSDWDKYPDQGIWLLPADAENAGEAEALRVTTVPPGYDYDSEPAWSPDGSWLAFTRFKSCKFRDHGRQAGIPNGCISAIFRVRPDGSEQQQLTPWGMAASYPNWSPDGTKIAFDGCDNGKTGCRGDIWVMNADGSHRQRLTSSPTTGLNRFDFRNNPDWSPDGTKLVYTHWCDNGGSELVTLASDGTGAEQTLVGCDGPFKNKADWGTNTD